MRTFELRIYTLRSKDALELYKDRIYPRHLAGSLAAFGIQAHGLWTSPADTQPRLYVLASYPGGQDPEEVARRYMKSQAFLDDIKDFDVTNIVGVTSTILEPTSSSPLS